MIKDILVNLETNSARDQRGTMRFPWPACSKPGLTGVAFALTQSIPARSSMASALSMIARVSQ